MTDNGCAFPIKAHQQVHLPLLRRPRAPQRDPGTQPSKNTHTNLPLSCDAGSKDGFQTSGDANSKLDVLGPLPPLHPTPFTPYRQLPHRHSSHPHSSHSYTSHSHTPHTPTTLQKHSRSYYHCKKNKFPEEMVGSVSSSTENHSRPDPPLPRPTEEIYSLGPGYASDLLFPPGEHSGKLVGPVPPEKLQFTLNDFLIEPDEVESNLMPTKLRGCTVSCQNYLKLTSWFSTHVPQHTSLNTLSITVDHQEKKGRKPQHQILLELKALIKEAIECEPPDDTPSQYDISSPRDGDKESSISQVGERARFSDGQLHSSLLENATLFRASTSRYFCGQGRSDSPFDCGSRACVSPAEVAVLESMMEGGWQLSLKAHFLASLPSLSLLSLTLSHLNISFNDLTVFPTAVLELTHLATLKMRNNPISVIPDGISALVRLETLCMPFNLVTHLPSGLFSLQLLSELDVSHNALQNIPHHIRDLRNLKKLNVEGNELIGLPPSILSLPLSHLLVSDNYMHSCLWRENCKNQPQALLDICCTTISRCTTLNNAQLPSSARDILCHRLDPHGRCDFCHGSLFHSQLRVIKPATVERFGARTLPLLFTACSQMCRRRHRYK